MRLLLTAGLLILQAVPSQADRFVFWGRPNLPIPGEGSSGATDTLSLPDNIIIEDLNVFLGINTHRLADLLVINIKSPWQDSVYLVNRNVNRDYLNVWFDTEDREDGPGQLINFNAHNSEGLWILHLEQPTDDFPFILESWAVEIYGQMTGIKDSIQIPRQFGVIATSPNPFNSRVSIQFAITEQGPVRLEIYNVLGQKVATLADTDLSPAIHQVTWDAGEFASGTYTYRLKSGDKAASGQLILIK